MKIAVFTDIHGNLEALEAILKDIKKQNVDSIICLGDTIGIGPKPKECINVIIENKIDMVLGNHELYAIKGTKIDSKIQGEELLQHKWQKEQLETKQIEFIKKCPLYYECNIEFNNKIPNQKIVFSHYLIKDDKLDYPFEETHLKNDINLWIKYNDPNRTYIVGHLHKSFNENEVEGISGDYIEELDELTNIMVLDSAGCTTNNETSYMLIEIGKSRKFSIQNVKYNRNKFLDTVRNTDYPDKKNIMKYFYGVEE